METLPTIVVPEETEDAVSLSSQPDQDTGISLATPGGPALAVPDEIAQKRAVKTQEGLGHVLKKSTEDIRREIAEGRENILRQQAAAQQNYENSITKQNMLINLAIKKQGPLDEDEVARVMDPFNPLNRPVDPDSVTEKAYAEKYIGSIQQAIDSTNSVVQKAKEEIPEQFAEAKTKGSELKFRMEFATKIKDDLGIMINNQGLGEWAGDEAANLFQLHNEYKMRGNNPEVGKIAGGLLLGDNLQEQADKILSLPTREEFTTKLKGITDEMAKTNPQLAYKFAEYVEGLPQTYRILDNAFTLMAIPDMLGIAKLGINVLRKIGLMNRTNTAMKALVKAGDDITASKVVRSEALGDVPSATVARSSDLILQDVAGKSDPVKFATDDSLLTMLNQDKDKIGTNTGSLSREQVVRIQDAYDASGKNILSRILETTRVNRIPMAVATQNAVRVIKDAIKEYYPGIRNAILDVSNPLYEPKSNTYWHEVTFGNIGGDLFSNPQTAKNFADLHGWNDVHIVEGYGSVTPAVRESMLERQAQLHGQISDWEQTIQRRKAEARDTKLSEADRTKASEQADGIKDFVKKAKSEVDDIGLKLRSNETYNRAKKLEIEIEQLRVRNKELRANFKKGENLSEDTAKLYADSIKFGEEQVRAKAQEINSLKSGNAEAIGRPSTVEQHGVGFKIVLRRPLVETDKAIRDLMIRDASGKLIPEAISTSSQTGLKSLFNAALGRFRGADDTLALNDSIQRKIATYSQSLFKQWAFEEMKYIRQVASGVIREDPVTGEKIPYWRAKPAAIYNKLKGETRETNDAFTRTLDYSRDAHDPVSGKIGYFFETPGQLEEHYMKNFDRPPSFAEHQAYFAFVRLVEGDRIFREVSEFRNRARLGTEQFTISARGADGKIVNSDYFDGVARKEFPGGDSVMMIMSKKLGEEKLINLGGAALDPKKLANYRELVQQGRLKVIEVYASEYTPLRNFSDIAGNNHVRYVLTDDSKSKPIEFNHVNRRGGGHFEWDYDHYIKQAKMYHQAEDAPGVGGRFRSVYYGDNTFMPVSNHAMGQDITRKLNAVRELIRDGKLEEAEELTKVTLPHEWHELHDMFKPRRDEAGKVIPAALDMHEPFVVVPKNKTVLDMDRSLQDRYGGKEKFKDAVKSGSLSRQFQVSYNTERESTAGLRTIEDVGSQGNPLYRFDPAGAKMVDPITTMNRSLNRIINSTVMDDYKMYAVEHWLREAETHLELKAGQVASSPFWAFEQAATKAAFRSGTPPEVVQNLLQNRNKIKQFTGVPNTSDIAINRAIEWLADTAYTSFGPEVSRSIGAKALVNTPMWMLQHIKDPVTFARSVTFHAKLGLFNPAQLLVQAQTHAAIISINPLHGSAGIYGALLHGWSALNGDAAILKGLDNYATKIPFGTSRWKTGEFLEAREVGNRTGFFNVAGEYANLDTALKTDYVGNDFKNVLKAGTWFFTKGEQSTRVSAWYTAFREFRHDNPTKVLTRDDIGQILNKADLLTVNMSRASNSALQNGILSLPMQFLTYQIRLAELFMGNRISPMAKFRMGVFYSALYGAPSAVGLTGIPLMNSIREEAINRGYVVGENWLKSAVMEGLPAMALAQVTGNQYNIGGRYGSPGLTQFYDALKSDHTWYQLLSGAAGTTLMDTLTAGNNFFHVAGSMLNPNNKDKAFPLKLEDFVDVFKGISSVNQTWKMLAAINTGKWMSKNEGYIDDVSKASAVFMSLTGTNPQAQDDLYLKGEIRKSEIAMQKYYLKEFIQEQHRYFDAAKNKNEAQAKAFATRAHTLLEISGYPTEKMATAYAIAAKGYESQIDSSDFAFAFKNTPKSRSDFLGIPTPFTTQSNIPETREQQYKTQTLLNRKNKP